MHDPIELFAEQIEKFKSVMNRAISTLAPDAIPGDSLNLSNDQLRLIAGALGTEGTALEVKSYVLMELEKWSGEPGRKALLDQLMAVVMREIELLEFFPKGPLQRDVPLPSHVKILNADTGRSDEKMPIDEFLGKLRAISDSSVFKK